MNEADGDFIGQMLQSAFETDNSAVKLQYQPRTAERAANLCTPPCTEKGKALGGHCAALLFLVCLKQSQAVSSPLPESLLYLFYFWEQQLPVY